jgi:hypothetical protein
MEKQDLMLIPSIEECLTLMAAHDMGNRRVRGGAGGEKRLVKLWGILEREE